MMKAVEERKRNSHGGRFRPAEAEDHMFLAEREARSSIKELGVYMSVKVFNFQM